MKKKLAVILLALITAFPSGAEELILEDAALVESTEKKEYIPENDTAAEEEAASENDSTPQIDPVPEENSILEDEMASCDGIVRVEDTIPDSSAREDGELVISVEEISEVPVLEMAQEDNFEELELTVTGNLNTSGLAQDAMRAPAGRYFAGSFQGDFGSQLSKESKNIYDQLKDRWVNERKPGNVKVSFTAPYICNVQGSTSAELAQEEEYRSVAVMISSTLQGAYDALIADYPEVFWINNTSYSYSISFQKNGIQKNSKISDATIIVTQEAYSGASDDVAVFDRALENAYQSIHASVSSSTTQYLKVKAIHDWVCNHAVYEEGTGSHSAAGILVKNGHVVCEGYAKVFKLLCKKFGIDCILVVGDASGPHMWNYVKMDDGNWYLVDTTWDDGRYISYTYFLIGGNTKSMLGDMTVFEERVLYTNFSSSENTQNFSYPILTGGVYTYGGHTHTWKVTGKLEPTCTKRGYYRYACSCGSTSLEERDMLQHSFSGQKWAITKVPTAVSEGRKSIVCDNGCGTEYVYYDKNKNPVYARTSIPKLPATISVNVSSLKLKKGQSTSGLKVSQLAEGDYVETWTSSNTKVMTVRGNRNGTCTIKGKKTGSAILTITLASGKQQKVQVKIQKSAVKAARISGVPPNLSMSVNTSKKISATVNPFTCVQKITYKSSNKKVVSVNKKGVLSAQKAGKAVITVKCGKATAKCSVVVG